MAPLEKTKKRSKGTAKDSALSQEKDKSKKLRAQVRTLRKRVKQLEEELQIIHKLFKEEAIAAKKQERRATIKKVEPCGQCGNISFDTFTAGAYKFSVCQGCGHRRKHEA